MRAAPLVAAAFMMMALRSEGARAEGPVDELAYEMRAPCWDAYECRRNGRCTSEGDTCVARSEAHCEASSACREEGVRCKLDADLGRCVSRLGQKVDPATTKKVAPAPEDEPYRPRNSGAERVREAGLALTFIGGLGSVVGMVAGGLWELAPEGETKETLMYVSVGSLPSLAFLIPGVAMLHHQDGGGRVAVGPGSLRMTF